MRIKDVAEKLHLDGTQSRNSTSAPCRSRFAARRTFGGEPGCRLGAPKAARVRRVVMDLWRAFENSPRRNAPQAAILYDKFHVVSGLGEALDEVRKQEYVRLAGRDQSFIKGQKYTLLASRANLPLDGRNALGKLLAANKRLNAADLLKESFGRRRNYQTEGWARRFFENWKAALKWQRLKPCEKFARMVYKHGDGIAAYCLPEKIRCRWASSRASTTISAPSRYAPADCATRDGCASKSSRACPKSHAPHPRESAKSRLF